MDFLFLANSNMIPDTRLGVKQSGLSSLRECMFSAIEAHAVDWFVKMKSTFFLVGHPLATATTASNYAGTTEAIPVD